jgi:hypothetical protein
MLCYHNVRLHLTAISLENLKNVTHVLLLEPGERPITIGSITGAKLCSYLPKAPALHQVDRLPSQDGRSAPSQIDTHLTDVSPAELGRVPPRRSGRLSRVFAANAIDHRGIALDEARQRAAKTAPGQPVGRGGFCAAS